MSNNNCKECNEKLLSKDAKLFCSKSCSAKFNNKRRKPRSNHSRMKTSESLKKPLKSKILYLNCHHCNKLFVWMFKKKFCSSHCQRTAASLRQTYRLKNDSEYRKKLGRKSMSYMEKSFSEWLDMHGIEYEQEKHFYNHILNKNYYVDFYFKNLSLIIELDGNQHIKTIEKDQIRDKFIADYYNLKIARISHKEYQLGSKTEYIMSILGL